MGGRGSIPWSSYIWVCSGGIAFFLQRPGPAHARSLTHTPLTHTRTHLYSNTLSMDSFNSLHAQLLKESLRNCLSTCGGKEIKSKIRGEQIRLYSSFVFVI